MIILETCQKQPFDIIAMTRRGTLRLCCVHIAQLMTNPAIYTLLFTLQLCYKPPGILQRVTKSQKVHISSHDELEKLYNINFAYFHRLPDDANENHNYIEYLFIFWTALSDSSLHFLNCFLERKRDNLGPKWIWIAHFPKNRFLRKLTVTIVYEVYSFILQHLKESSKSKSLDKRLHNCNPNPVWVTSLKKNFLWKLNKTALIKLLYIIMPCHFKKISTEQITRTR